MRLIRALHAVWLARAAQSDLERANFYASRACDRMAALGFTAELTFTASGVPAVAAYRVRHLP